MRELGVDADERDLGKQPLSVAEIDALIGERDHLAFLNTRNAEYRARELKQNPPARAEALELMAANPNLIKRPLLVHGEDILYGFTESDYRERLG